MDENSRRAVLREFEKFVNAAPRPGETMPFSEGLEDALTHFTLADLERIHEYDDHPEKLPWGSIKTFFIENFFTPEMKKDLPFILKDILKYQAEEFSKYVNADSDTIIQDDKGLDSSIYCEISKGLVDMAFDGSQFAREMLLALYRTYYRKEYTMLKKFKTFDGRRDTLSFIGGEKTNGDDLLNILSRLLVFSKFMGIKLINVGVIFMYIDDVHRSPHRYEDRSLYDFSDIPDKKELLSYINFIQSNFDAEDNGYIWEQLDICIDVFEEAWTNLGMSPLTGAYGEMWTGEIFCRYAPYAMYLADHAGICLDNLMEEDILHLTALVFAAHAISGKVQEYIACIDILSGISEDYHRKMLSPRYKAISLQGETEKAPAAEKKEKPGAQENAEKGPAPADDREKEYKDRIRELEDRLREKDRAAKNMKSLYEEQKKKLNTLEKEAAGIRQDREELSRLRDFAASLDIEEDPLWKKPSVDIETMKDKIKDMKIAIIGGNENWRKKLRTIFPNWTFVYSHNYPVSFVKSAAHIFFFTDSLAHDLYYKYVTEAKNKGTPYSLMHGVELSSNIRYIYERTAGKKQ